ncbi:GPP34 family phosphoprotein [Streptomyces sp. NPDC057555]|uniref:GOLPH3/VPS74 family protein n=1 Tax=Streptomyces sp. NPDC057555 TaxID=3346166 RepID=UPI0036817B60
MKTTLGEQIMLLSLDDDTGVPKEKPKADYSVAAATLAELALEGRIDIVDDKVAVQDRTPLEVPALDAILKAIDAREKPAKPQDLLAGLTKEAVAQARRGLLDKGLVREEKKKVWGILPVSRYPEADGVPEAELRAGLARVVLEGATPDARQTALLAVLHGAGLHKLVLPGADRKAVNRRMEELADGQWVATAIRKTLELRQVAVIASL